MSDGNRLENVGVIPDYPIGPTAYALANARIRARHVAKQLVHADDQQAGDFKFLKSKDEDEDDEETDEEN